MVTPVALAQILPDRRGAGPAGFPSLPGWVCGLLRGQEQPACSELRLDVGRHVAVELPVVGQLLLQRLTVRRGGELVDLALQLVAVLAPVHVRQLDVSVRDRGAGRVLGLVDGVLGVVLRAPAQRHDGEQGDGSSKGAHRRDVSPPAPHVCRAPPGSSGLGGRAAAPGDPGHRLHERETGGPVGRHGDRVRRRGAHRHPRWTAASTRPATSSCPRSTVTPEGGSYAGSDSTSRCGHTQGSGSVSQPPCRST